MTTVERLVWARLRMRQLGGFKFRRQAPIGPYFADFACHEARLIVEIDGPTHDGERLIRDARRDDWLRAAGYRVVRFPVKFIDEQLDEAVEAILKALPSPLEGEGRGGGSLH